MNFVPLRIRQRDGRWVGVLNSEQDGCELPLPITSDEGLRDRELILGIRPEQIGLSEWLCGGPFAAGGYRSGGADRPRYAGRLRAQSGQGLLPAGAGSGAAGGETLNLQFDPRKVLLFDAQSGERLGLAQPATTRESKVTRLVSNGAGPVQ